MSLPPARHDQLLPKDEYNFSVYVYHVTINHQATMVPHVAWLR